MNPPRLEQSLRCEIELNLIDESKRGAICYAILFFALLAHHLSALYANNFTLNLQSHHLKLHDRRCGARAKLSSTMITAIEGRKFRSRETLECEKVFSDRDAWDDEAFDGFCSA
jgi:hypothetical protein